VAGFFGMGKRSLFDLFLLAMILLFRPLGVGLNMAGELLIKAKTFFAHSTCAKKLRKHCSSFAHVECAKKVR